MATDWSDEAKARRSAAAKKAAETRKRNRELANAPMPNRYGIYHSAHDAIAEKYPYIPNSRVARGALSGVSLIAMMHAAPNMRRREMDNNHPFYS